jgi:hypothetical protein
VRGAEAAARRCSEATAESGGQREWQRGPTAVGGREEGEGMTRWRENRPRVTLTGDREDNAGATMMRRVSACSVIGGWTRRQGSARGGGGLGLAPCEEKGGRREETLGQRRPSPFNGEGAMGQELGRRLGAAVGQQ